MVTPVVLHIDTGRRFRGGQNQVLLTIRYLARQGVSQLLAAPDYSDNKRNASLLSRLESIPSVPLSQHSLVRKLFVGKLSKAISERGVNIIHAHDSEAHTIGLRLKRKFPALLLIVTRRVIFRPAGRVSVKHKYLSGVDNYIAISRAVAETLDEIGIDRQKVTLIHSAIDLEAIKGTAPGNRLDEIRSKYDKLVVAVGALTEEKDFKMAISAFVQASLDRTALLIYGDGPMREELKRQIETHNNHNIFLMGHQETLSADLKQCHLFFLTSRSEGLNSAAIEAAACGLPLVVSDVGGLPEIAEDKYNALLCPVGDTARFVSALRKILLDDVMRKQMSENSIVKAAGFDIVIAGKKIMDLYNRLLEGIQ